MAQNKEIKFDKYFLEHVIKGLKNELSPEHNQIIIKQLESRIKKEKLKISTHTMNSTLT